jgi:tetratricopeptide (TPR) repeat protein
MTVEKLRAFIDYLKKSPLPLVLALISLATVLLTAVVAIIAQFRLAIVVISGLGSVLLVMYNIWIVREKTPFTVKPLHPKRFIVLSGCSLILCWMVVACMASNKWGGRALLVLGSRHLADKKLTEYLRHSQHDYVVWHWLVCAKLGKEFSEPAPETPTEADMWYWRGRIYDANNNVPGALDAFQSSIQLDPDNPRAYPWYVGTLIRDAEERPEFSEDRYSVLEKARKRVNLGIQAANLQQDESTVKVLQTLKCMILNDLAYTYAEHPKQLMLETAAQRIKDALPEAERLGGVYLARCLDTKAWIVIKQTRLSEDLDPNTQIARYETAEGLLRQALQCLPAEYTADEAEIRHHQGYVDMLKSETERRRKGAEASREP